MHYANFDLSSKVFEIYGWMPENHSIVDEDGTVTSNSPNYSLSFLLSKLPTNNRYTWQLEPKECHLFDRKTLAKYKGAGATPVDAVASLCIELAKANLIPIEEGKTDE